MIVSADILIVIATIVAAFSLSSIIAAWTIRRWPFMAMVSLLIAVGIGVYVHMNVDGGLTLLDVPDAFISVAARFLN